LAIEGTIYFEHAVVSTSYTCTISGENKGVMIKKNCDFCQWSWHITCLSPLMVTFPKRKWVYPCYKKAMWLMDSTIIHNGM
jgi:hypothetical protein